MQRCFSTQIFSDHFIHLYDATKFIISALPDDIRGRLDSVLQSASEGAQRARGIISDKPELKNILVLVLSVRDFFHFSQPARKTKGDHDRQVKHRLERHNSDFFDAIQGCNLDMDFLYNSLYKISECGMMCMKDIKTLFASTLSCIEKFSESALEAPLEISKRVLNTILLGFINAMVELNKYLEDSSRMCEEAMAHTKLRVSEDTKEVAKISSLGTEWATKLDRWLQLHPEAKRGPIPPLEEKEANSPSRWNKIN